MATETTTRWSVRGTLLIACNCDYGCPCNFNAPPSRGKCEGGWIWHVEEGTFGDVDLGGVAFSLHADWPGAIHEGGGKAVAFVDERATDEQVEAVTELVRGGHGGPWGIFINTYELDGPHAAPFEIHLDGLETRVTVGDKIELELDTIRNPVTGAEVRPGIVLPEGLVCKEAALGTSKVFRVSDGIAYDHSGQYTAVAPFDYTGP